MDLLKVVLHFCIRFIAFVNCLCAVDVIGVVVVVVGCGGGWWL